MFILYPYMDLIHIWIVSIYGFNSVFAGELFYYVYKIALHRHLLREDWFNKKDPNITNLSQQLHTRIDAESEIGTNKQVLIGYT